MNFFLCICAAASVFLLFASVGGDCIVTKFNPCVTPASTPVVATPVASRTNSRDDMVGLQFVRRGTRGMDAEGLGRLLLKPGEILNSFIPVRNSVVNYNSAPIVSAPPPATTSFLVREKTPPSGTTYEINPSSSQGVGDNIVTYSTSPIVSERPGVASFIVRETNPPGGTTTYEVNPSASQAVGDQLTSVTFKPSSVVVTEPSVVVREPPVFVRERPSTNTIVLQERPVIRATIVSTAAPQQPQPIYIQLGNSAPPPPPTTPAPPPVASTDRTAVVVQTVDVQNLINKLCTEYGCPDQTGSQTS